jgi:hypothetical protein
VKAAAALTVIVAGLVIGLGGCAQYYWSKSGGTAEQFDGQSRACAQQAAENPTAAAHGIVDDKRYRACMAASGWVREKQWQPAPAGWYRGIE